MPKSLSQLGVNIGGRQFEPVVWYKHACLRQLYFLVGVIWLSSATGGFDGSMMNGLQSLNYWEDYFTIQALPHNLGRKKTLIIGLLVLFVGIGIQTGSVNIGMFIASRFIGGIGSSMGTGPYLISELSHPQHRATVTAIYNTTYYVGAIIAAWATYGTLYIQSNWAWRLPSLLQYITPLIQFALIWWVPESPRFLINQDRPEEARAILEKFHGPCSSPEFVQAEFDEIYQTSQLERQFAKKGWKELWSTKGDRHRFAICLALGFFANTAGNAILSYCLHQVLDSIGISSKKEQLRINGILQIYNWVFALGVTFFIGKIGRRPLFLISVGGMLCTFIAWTAFSAIYSDNGSSGMAKGVLACISIYYAFYDMAWSGLYQAYAVEVLPYPIRARGLAVVVLCAYAAVFFANYVNPLGLANAGWKYYVLYDCWLVVIWLTIYFLFVETKNIPLEEVAKVFDGEDALVGGGVEMSKKEIELVERKVAVDHVEEVGV